jgi:hypothetical protein
VYQCRSATSTTWNGGESKQSLFSEHKTTKQQSRDQACTLFFFLFFFFRRYNFNSLNVLAFSTYNYQFLRSWMQLVQFLIFSFFMSFLMSSSHLFFGPPSGLLNIGFHLCTFFYHSFFWHSL